MNKNYRMVISFSKLGAHGRLGNQLFQWWSTVGIAQANGCEASFPAWKYAAFFETQLPHGKLATQRYTEPRFEFDMPQVQDVDLFGYFQSYKYFPEGKPQFKEDFKQHCRARLPKGELVAVQIRRGDYVNHPDYYQIPITWYIEAIQSMPKDAQFVFFSDDLDYCKVHFECLPNAHFIKANEIEHLCMMSLCDQHIIANSSYGWWGAYLSEQKNVLYNPNFFTGKLAANTTSDYYPANWHSFDVPEKISIPDLTITIPVMWDHADRKQNVDLCLCLLQKSFDVSIVVGECRTDKFAYTAEFCTYRKFKDEQFHRTKMLNEMAMAAETDYVANWDCDIFIPPMQLVLTMQLLREGANVVYPYDGRFARMERRIWFRKVEAITDIGAVGQHPLHRRDKKESVGGCLVWNKNAFIDYGMENEYMISYAPEDVERWERMHKLGANPRRIEGTLYHMDHYKGPDSHNGNPHFQKSKALLANYRAMNADQLRQEVDSWPWRHKYTPAYYERIIEGAVRSAKHTYEAIGFKGGVVVDVGCGIGEWACGNDKYLGIDFGSPKKHLLIPEDDYRDIDLETAPHIIDEVAMQSHPLAWALKSVMQDTKAALCICLEVAEHISEGRADWLIEQLCNISDTVLFSAAIPNQGGTGHVNEQWQTYWAERFYKHGFGAEMCYPVKDNPEVEMWYRQNMILYKKGATGKVYNFVLPEYYYQITTGLKNQIK